MQYSSLGNSDLKVSRICMGCMGFGDAQNGQHSWTVDEAHSREIIRRGLELGVNFFDTAIAYQSGTSEQYLGRALRDFARREDVVVATKFLPRTPEEIAGGVSGQEHIARMLDKSLENLGMEYVDLYIYHMWDYQTPLCDIMEGLNRVVRQGKARYIGISNCFAFQLAQANALAEREGFAQFVSVQGHYNLIFREEEREMAKLCAQENIAMTPYSALAGGRLAKRPGESSKRLLEDSYAQLKYDAAAEQDADVIARVAELAERRGVSMTEISLAWLLTKVTAPVVGATKLSHIEGAAKAVDLTLISRTGWWASWRRTRRRTRASATSGRPAIRRFREGQGRRSRALGARSRAILKHGASPIPHIIKKAVPDESVSLHRLFIMESWLRHPLNKNAPTVLPARAPVPEWQEAKSASSARGAGGQFVREHMLAHVVLAVCAISVCRALLHPIYNASKPASSARTATRGHILPHSLPAARALSPHYPIFNIPSKGYGGLPPCLPIGP